MYNRKLEFKKNHKCRDMYKPVNRDYAIEHYYDIEGERCVWVIVRGSMMNAREIVRCPFCRELL